ncbi:MAG: zinc ribbon domain-containing protein [Clostridia bacterium]|nr:zinc ribbon domain-containing protein [Clostridia bacterium]
MPKTCPKCGYANGELDMYCKLCATPLTKTDHPVFTVAAPIHINDEPAPIVEQWVKVCPKCKTSNPECQRFCMECSHSLTDVQPCDTGELWERQLKELEKKEKHKIRMIRIGSLLGGLVGLALGILILMNGGNAELYFGGVILMALGFIEANDPEGRLKREYRGMIKKVEFTSYGIEMHELGCIISVFFGFLVMCISTVIK